MRILMGKKQKKCSGKSKKLLWYSLTISTLILRGISTLALFIIAMNMTTLKKQSHLTKLCIAQSQSNGLSLPEAVNYCQGGGD